MIALCTRHAREADNRAISKKTLYQLKKDARGAYRQEVGNRFTILDWTRFAIEMEKANVRFENCTIALRVDGTKVIWFSNVDGYLALSVDLRDQAGNVLLQIDENDWVVNVGDVWDCEVTGNRICVRDSSRTHFVDFRLDAECDTVYLNYRVCHAGEVFAATEKGFQPGPVPYLFQNFCLKNMAIAFDVYRDPQGNRRLRIGVPSLSPPKPP